MHACSVCAYLVAAVQRVQGDLQFFFLGEVLQPSESVKPLISQLSDFPNAQSDFAPAQSDFISPQSDFRSHSLSSVHTV